MTHVTLPVARLLKKAGYPQDSTKLRWCGGENYFNGWQLVPKDNVPDEESIASPCVGELLEKLPAEIGGDYTLTLQKALLGYTVYYENCDYLYNFGDEAEELEWINNENPADALGLLFVKLKEEGLI